MNFSVHFDDETLDRLAQAVKRTELTRNRIIVKAVQEWLERNEERDWPEALKAHFGNPAPDLESDEDDLTSYRPLETSGRVQW